MVGNGPAFEAPQGLAVETTGQVLVVDATLQVLLRVDPVSGHRTVLSSTTMGHGPSFLFPFGIALEATGQILVLDSRGITRVDPLSGDRMVVSNISVGSGPLWHNAGGLAIEATGQILVTERDALPLVPGGLFRVDAHNGNRALISR